ncbi:MAG: FemAB family XrtA/PEP-CTERM system-associated protein, partial [Terracidiphilus sp.]
IHTCTENDNGRWDEYVSGHPECTSYHRWSWKHVFEDVFGWPGIYLLAEQRGTVRGILPLIRQRCLLRSYLSSMPHLKGGGIVADSSEVENLLFESAIDVVRRSGATYLELRHLKPHDLPLVLRRDKVGAVLPIEADIEKRLRRLDKKARNLVRKSLTYGMTAEFGGGELLPAFYEVYRQNMHDLGSPAYSRRFFLEILNRFPNESHLCITRLGGKEVAGAFIIGFRGTLEVAWASSYRKFQKLKPNMFLYWNILSFAAEQGYKFLDFGRSSRGSGTYEFKLQWGAVPSDLYWCYWLNREAPVPEARAEGMQMASRIWRRLPVAFTNVLGPTLIRHIPGI